MNPIRFDGRVAVITCAADFETLIRVHLPGCASCSRAALAPMQTRHYGRTVMTTLAAGLYGNFGQGNYSAATGAALLWAFGSNSS